MSKIEVISPTAAGNAAIRLNNPVVASGIYARFGKRIVDLAFVLCLLPVAVPVIAILALLVSRDGAKPFFGHRRVGHNGKTFYCWKVRSMVADAETRLAAHLAADPAAKAEWEATFKLDNDPRITRLGHFIRKTSLDELPQLWNILKGEMSVVGPRPVTAEELTRYGSDAVYYKAMRPGLTGLWQVSGRNTVSYDERVEMDVTYSQSFGFWQDLRIILLTAKAVLSRTGK